MGDALMRVLDIAESIKAEDGTGSTAHAGPVGRPERGTGRLRGTGCLRVSGSVGERRPHGRAVR